MIEVPVLIAGGGPVGLTLSLELAHFGIKSLVAERNPTTTSHPKMDLTNGRSMELFRRTGLADKLRAVGVPPKSNFNISWITDLSENGHELQRFPYLSADDEYWRRRTNNDGSLTLEAPLRVSQIVIEPVLKKAADESPNIDVRFSWRLESFIQDAEGVTSLIKNTQTGEEQQVRSRFLVGCDGGSSTVRKQLGIENEGQSNVARLFMIHFRSRALDVLQRFGIAWHYQTGKGVIVAQDDKEFWTLHVFLEPGCDESKLDPRSLVEEWVGCKFDFEVIVANPWSAHYLVAQKYSNGRVFLAGDACHQFMPTGGYGMNTGIAEVGNLSWKLAAAIHGWGGQALLDSYHAERRPVAKLSWATSETHLKVRFALAEIYAEAGNVSGATPEAHAKRLALGRKIADLTNAENEGWGTEHGYRYAESPIVVNEAGDPPKFDSQVYIPTTWPGSRLPNVFLSDGTAVYDHLGKWYTVIVLNSTDTTAIDSAAKAKGIPLKVLRLDDANARRIYERDLVLVRADHHVAWRGNAFPQDCYSLLARLSGNAS
ncbi:MAG: FAD-dependent monooxygenase [Rhodocyclaceae bacterium]|nr:FAD-dependent monooxygenase [Rhodocyclaceae bacterium]